jgi:hypothetical protein
VSLPLRAGQENQIDISSVDIYGLKASMGDSQV